jgi:N-acetylglutamate synthase
MAITGAELTLPTPLEIERAGLKAWPGIEVEWDGAWVRRAANGLTQRANSVQCFDPSDDGDVDARIAAVQRWYASRGQSPIFRVNLLSGPSLLGALNSQGWAEVDHSQLMAMPMPEVEADPRGIVLSIDDPAFVRAQRLLKPYDDATLAKFRAILAVLRVPAAGIVLRDNTGRPVSSALMAVADGIVITGNVVTDRGERRKGYASAMMRTGLAWAADAGARFAALNVAKDNPGAIRLYEGLGFRWQYDYVYRTPRTA